MTDFAAEAVFHLNVANETNQIRLGKDPGMGTGYEQQMLALAVIQNHVLTALVNAVLAIGQEINLQGQR